MICDADSNIGNTISGKQNTDFTQYFCRECRYHFHDVFANGICGHQEISMEMPDYFRACRKFHPKREGYDEDSV